MEELRKTESHRLHKGDGMARGLYNITANNSDKISFWFGCGTRDDLLSCSNTMFDKQCEYYLKCCN